MKVKVEYGDIFSQKWFHNWLGKKVSFLVENDFIYILYGYINSVIFSPPITVVNQALPSFHGDSLEIKITVPFIIFMYNVQFIIHY